jgi:hypothetical protein
MHLHRICGILLDVISSGKNLYCGRGFISIIIAIKNVKLCLQMIV